ncbi:MAG: outer membrane lipoprotein carrier protein LolA [bacterium]
MKLIVGFLIFVAGVTLSGSDILQEVEKKYGGIKTMSADFSQKITYASTDRKSTFTGRLLLGKPDKMRMSVLEPDTQLLVSTGGTLWVYIKEAHQALFYDLTEESYPQLGTLIFNIGQQFQSELTGKNAKDFILKLVPLEESEYYDSLYAKVSRRSYLINGLTVFDMQANRIDYAFTRIRTNIRIKEDQFRFTPPPGTQIIKRQ